MTDVIDLSEKREERRQLQDVEELQRFERKWQWDQSVFMNLHQEYLHEPSLMKALDGVVVLLANSDEYADKNGKEILEAAHEEIMNRMPNRVKQSEHPTGNERLMMVYNDQSQPLTVYFNAGFQRSRYLEALRSAITTVEGGYLEGGIETGDDVTLRRGDWEEFIKRFPSQSRQD